MVLRIQNIVQSLCTLFDSIYLVDHAWTYNSSIAEKMLRTVGGLLDRMCRLMDIDVSPASGDDQSGNSDRVSTVLDKMWLYNQTYSIAGTELVTPTTLFSYSLA